MGLRNYLLQRKKMKSELKTKGYKNTFMIRNKKARALLQAEKTGVNISKFKRMTSMKEIDRARRSATENNIMKVAEMGEKKVSMINGMSPALKKEFLELQRLMNTNPSKFGKDWSLYRKGMEEARQRQKIQRMMDAETEGKIAQTARAEEERGRVIDMQKNPDKAFKGLNPNQRRFMQKSRAKLM